MLIRGNGVTLRTHKVIQGGDNGHVGRPCEVSPAPPCPELCCELRGLCRRSNFGPRTCSRSEKTKFIEVVMSTCAVSSKHKDAEHRPLVVGMIFWDLREV